MANRPLTYVLSERKATLGKLAGKTVIQAVPTGRKRIDHRSFCEEVGRATTFTGAVLRLAAEIAKRHVENGDSVDFGDIGTLPPPLAAASWKKARKSLTQQSTFPNQPYGCNPHADTSPSRA